MKKILLLISISITIIYNAHSQANNSLSNLTVTSINKNLIPASDNSKDVGSAGKSWKNVYVSGAVYLDGAQFIDNKGTENTFIGVLAGFSNTTGSFNTANGFHSFQLNTAGSNNTAIGRVTLYSNTTGSANTANGSGALGNNTTGSYNTANGYLALGKNSSGYYNTAYGNYALVLNVSGSHNTAIGNRALNSSVANSFNVAVGDSVLSVYNDGTLIDYMTGVGYGALAANTIGWDNTAIGSLALSANTSGAKNTAIGTLSLTNNTTGYYNTVLGAFANTNNGNRINATAIGFDALATADNQVMLGNTAVTSVMAAGSFVIYSDGRFKKNIKENVPGLDFINQLRPVTYQYDVHGMNKYIAPDQSNITGNNKNRTDDVMEKAISNKEKKIYTGFVAQEVEAAAAKSGYEFSGVHKPENAKDLYGLSYSEFVVPLVKAVQELSQQNNELIQRIEKLEAMMNTQQSATQQQQISNSKQSIAFLAQNTPNPFSQSTSIHYTLPANFNDAKIIITDYAGKILKQFSILPGNGTVNIDAGLLSSGSYNYSLLINEKTVDTKRMVLTK